MLKSQRTRLWFLLLLASITLFSLGCRQSAYQFKGTYLDSPMVIPDFTLSSHTGQPFQSGQDIQDGLAVILFGYTSCPDICPLTLLDIEDALEGLSPAERTQVQVILITADPNRDTPDVLKRYLSAFDTSITGLTGDVETVQNVMAAFGASAEAVSGGTQAGYLVSHTARVYVLTPDGEVPLTYTYGFNPESLRSDLSYLVAQSN